MTPFRQVTLPVPAFPLCLVLGQRFVLSSLSSRRCVCWQRWSAREALLSPGSPSQAPGDTGEYKEYKATALVLVSIAPQCRCWEPTRGCQPWVALGQCRRACWRRGEAVARSVERGWELLAAGEHLLDTAPTGRCPRALSPAPGTSHRAAGAMGMCWLLLAPRTAAVPWAEPASPWLGRRLLLQKMGLHPAQKKSKMAFLEGRRTTGPGMLHCAPAKAARHAGGCSAGWGRDPDPPYPNTLGPGSQPACRHSGIFPDCGFDVSHPAGRMAAPALCEDRVSKQEP